MELKDAEIRDALAPFGVEVGDHLAGQIRAYVRLLLLWNQKINLTSVTAPREILTRHFGESMFGAQLLAKSSGVLADVGSGAGFPGLALKLACPALRIKLIEPTIKKAVFLSEVVRALELSGVEVLKERTESIRELEVDVVTARAVGDLRWLVEWSSDAVIAGGQVMLWLGMQDVAAVRGMDEFEWKEPVAIPLSSQRVILQGVKA